MLSRLLSPPVVLLSLLCLSTLISFLFNFTYICISLLSDVEAFARAMQGTKGDSKEKKEDDEDMSLD